MGILCEICIHVWDCSHLETFTEPINFMQILHHATHTEIDILITTVNI